MQVFMLASFTPIWGYCINLIVKEASLGQFEHVARMFVPLKDKSLFKFFSFLEQANFFYVLCSYIKWGWNLLTHIQGFCVILFTKETSLGRFEHVARTFIPVNDESLFGFFSFLE